MYNIFIFDRYAIIQKTLFLFFMAVTCTISKRANGINKTPEHVYHLKPLINQTVDMDELATRISNSCSLTHADVVACISALNKEVIKALKAGDKVDLMWLGSFKIALETEAQPMAQACSKNDIKRVKVNYQPGRHIKKELQAFSNFKIDSKAALKYP